MWGGGMKVTKDKSKESIIAGEDLLQKLDKGIDDMEAGREMPLEEAFEKITELRNSGREAEK